MPTNYLTPRMRDGTGQVPTLSILPGSVATPLSDITFPRNKTDFWNILHFEGLSSNRAPRKRSKIALSRRGLADSGCKDDDVVQVYQADLEIKSRHDHIHQPLESRRCTCKAEWHYSELKSAFTGDKRGFLCASRIHLHLVVSGPEVKRRKPTGSSQGIQTGVDSE